MLKNRTYSRYYFRIVVETMVLAIFLMLSIDMVGAQTSTIIRDDATGGDCTLIGIWDNTTKTCTLTTNPTGTIQIDNNGITLNGNGHTIAGNGTGNGVDISLNDHITVKNLILENFDSGISLGQSFYNNLTENIILNSKYGITLVSSNHNNLINNTALNNSVGINLLYYPSSFNNITGNTAKNNDYGIVIRGHYNNFTNNIVSNSLRGFSIYRSSYNNLKNNTISYNSESGISSDYSSQNNTFISNTVSDNPGPGLFARYGENNSFIENTFSNNSIGIVIVGGERNYKIFNNYFNNSDNSRVQVSSSLYDIWNTTKQPGTNIIGGPYLGGNFWAHPNGTGFSQTCPDNNKDGICDIEYTLNENNTDYLPLALAATSNLIINPGFESGTTPWMFYTNGAGKFTAALPGYEGSKSANIVLYTGGMNIQLYQKGISLEPKTRYRLSFAAYSRTGHDLKVKLINHASPYTGYGLDKTFNLSASWQEFSTEFTTIGFTDSINNGRLMFYLAPFAKAGDKYYFDSVKLVEI